MDHLNAESESPGVDRMLGNASDQFELYRRYLFSIAYRLLGSASEAEDVVQDAYLRFVTKAPAEVASVKAYLSTVVTRLSLDALKSARLARESYVGPWLPEPVPTDQVLSPPELAERADDVSFAFLLLLERLTPEERVVFVMREAFDEPYDQIATTIGKSVAATRQLAHRAREHVNDDRPRYAVSSAEHEAMTMRFLAAAREGDLQAMIEQLAPDAVTISDGGGRVLAAVRPIVGADRVARGAIGVMSKLLPEARFVAAEFNGQRGVVQWVGSTLVGATVVFYREDDLIQSVMTVVNPDKLRYFAQFVQPPEDEERGGD